MTTEDDDKPYIRQIVLDTETTGLEPKQGHRIIEIGCVEVLKRRVTRNDYHQYLQPDREIDEEAQKVHGISPEFLADKPRFADVVDAFMEYVKGAELLIHNAPFDIGFLNHELALANSRWGRIEDHCKVTDTLAMARARYPGQRNSLDALCRRLDVDNGHRELHGALLDSQILADVYLALTGGQRSLMLEASTGQDNDEQQEGPIEHKKLTIDRSKLVVIRANDEELQQHDDRLAAIRKQAGDCVWDRA